MRLRYLEFTSGQHAIREFESCPGRFRAFCSVCGSPVYSRMTSDPETRMLRAGSLDGDPGRRPLAHVRVAHKAPWFEITDALPRHAGLPPEYEDR